MQHNLNPTSGPNVSANSTPVQLSEKSDETFIEKVWSNASYGQSLTSLTLSCNSKSLDIAFLLSLEALCQLTIRDAKLDMSQLNRMTDSIPFSTFIPNIKKFHLEKCEDLDNRAPSFSDAEIARRGVFKRSPVNKFIFTQLQHLSLIDVKADTKLLTQLIKNFYTIESLHIDDNKNADNPLLILFYLRLNREYQPTQFQLKQLKFLQCGVSVKNNITCLSYVAALAPNLVDLHLFMKFQSQIMIQDPKVPPLVFNKLTRFSITIDDKEVEKIEKTSEWHLLPMFDEMGITSLEDFSFYANANKMRFYFNPTAENLKNLKKLKRVTLPAKAVCLIKFTPELTHLTLNSMTMTPNYDYYNSNVLANAAGDHCWRFNLPALQQLNIYDIELHEHDFLDLTESKHLSHLTIDHYQAEQFAKIIADLQLRLKNLQVEVRESQFKRDKPKEVESKEAIPQKLPEKIAPSQKSRAELHKILCTEVDELIRKYFVNRHKVVPAALQVTDQFLYGMFADFGYASENNKREKILNTLKDEIQQLEFNEQSENVSATLHKGMQSFKPGKETGDQYERTMHCLLSNIEAKVNNFLQQAPAPIRSPTLSKSYLGSK